MDTGTEILANEEALLTGDVQASGAAGRSGTRGLAPAPEFMSPSGEYRAALFIETYTGRAFKPLEPDPTAISVIDIAHALSNQCRYSGQVSEFYSTAQHCCLLASYARKLFEASPLDTLQILMHDAAEAYLVDVPRPVKQYMPQYREWDHGVETAVRTWLGIAAIPHPEFQDELDSRIIVDERKQLFSDSGLDWWGALGSRGVREPLGITIDPWTPKEAERKFLLAYGAYTYAAFGEYWYMDEAWLPGDKPLRAVYHATASDSPEIADLIEVDFRGRVGRVKLRSENGMLIRDRDAAPLPRPAWAWRHGNFTLGGSHGV